MKKEHHKLAPQEKKKYTKEITFYVIMMTVAIAVLWYISSIVPAPEPSVNGDGAVGSETTGMVGYFNTFVGSVQHHASSQFGLLLAQIIIILLFARGVAWCFVKLKQPSVIGEILAGIILGPSVLGALFPGTFSTIFPEESLYNITLLSQFGLILFMFVIGMELEISEIQKRLRQSMIIAHSGIVIPFILGAVVALYMFNDYGSSPSNFLPFILFVGISMSITAFPVLARIVQEKGKMNSHIGIVSLASAANGDITAWCLIAVIMAISQAGSPLSALFTILFAGAYLAVMFFVVRPLFKLIGEVYNNSEVASKGVIAVVFMTLLISAYLTEILGLHALFGAFIAGVIMPEDMKFRRILTDKVEDVSLSIFLPLFFVSSGLQTEIGLLNTPTHWWITLLLIVIAVIGKLGGSYLAARVVGETKLDSLYIGILMNTRGLMELVVLSMGMQLGILSPIVFAMLVIMTLVTTFMTTPLIDLTNKLVKLKAKRQGHDENGSFFKILFSFGRTSTGLLMLNIVHTLFPNKESKYKLQGMHMTIGTDVSPLQAEEFRRSSFAPIGAYSEEHGIDVEEVYEVTDHPTHSIVRAANEGGIDLLLVGAGIDLSSDPTDKDIAKMRRRYKGIIRASLADAATSFFNIAALLKNKTKHFIKNANMSVGIVVDRGLRQKANSILIVHDHNNRHINNYTHLVKALTEHSESKIVCLEVGDHGDGDSADKIYNCEMLKEHDLNEEMMQGIDLMLIPFETWRHAIANRPDIVNMMPTTVILSSKLDKPFGEKKELKTF